MDRSGGTSGAAPILAGALAVVQGVLKAAGHAPLTPHEARQLLRETGSPQQYSADHNTHAEERIGNLPDLRTLIPAAMRLRDKVKDN